MIRKLIVVCFAALAAMAMTAATASAQHGVVVTNPGAFEAESEVDIAVVTHVGGIEVRELSCDNHWDVDIGPTGEGTVNAEGIFPHANDTGSCETAEPCNSHAAWPAELEEEQNPARFMVHVTFCLENTAIDGLEGSPFPVECDYDAVNDIAHCDTPLVGLPGLEVEGEVVVHPNAGGGPGVDHG